MNDILQKILAAKRQRVEARRQVLPLNELKNWLNGRTPHRDFFGALARPVVNIIAEVKKASPSAGVIREDFEPALIAEDYYAGGAAAISVLTEEDFFKGGLAYLEQVRYAVPLPLLRKDFIFDPYQVYEAAVFGADAILLIAAMLAKDELTALHDLATELGLDCLVEVHNREELDAVLGTPARIIGINNRNLKSLAVDLHTSEELINGIPKEKVAVVESGIRTGEDIARFRNMGAHAFLVGETLMRSTDPRSTLQEFINA